MFNYKNLHRRNLSSLSKIKSKINIKLIITLFCLIFFGSSIYRNFDDLSNQIINLREVLWLLGGVLFSSLSIIINAYAWKFLINSIGCDSSKLNIIKLFLNTNIYKYVPGGVWHFVSRYNALRLEFSIEKSLESILLEPLLMTVAGLFFLPFGRFNLSIYILCWSSTLIFLTGFRGFIIKNLKAMKASIFNRSDKYNTIDSVQNKYNTTVKISYPYKALFVEIMFILFRFLGFFCCLKAFFIGGSLISLSQLISSFSLAWIVGLIVPAAPGGVGVFESVVLFAIGSQLPEAPLLVSLLFYRLVAMISDILSSSIYPVRRLLKV